MRIAIAGSGDFAQYIAEEFPKAGLRPLILTRTYKPRLEKDGVLQFITDYSDASLDEALIGCDALISTIVDFSLGYVDIHLKLLGACQRSPTCKRFIPSEFAGNIKDYPDQPAYFRNINEHVRRVLQEQKDIQWTLVCIGLFADYVVPSTNRYIRDMREGSLIDFKTETFWVPGSLQDGLDLTAARDVAKSLAALLYAKEWEPYTFLSGQRASWKDITDVIRKRYPHFTIRINTVNQIIDHLAPGKPEAEILFAQLQLYPASGAAKCPKGPVKEQKKKYFSSIHFQSLEDIWKKVDIDPNVIV